MTEDIRVLVSGAAGRMGREVVKAVTGAEGMRLVAAVDTGGAGQDAGELAGVGRLGVSVEAGLAAALTREKPDVVVDFTRPDAVMGNLRVALGAGVKAVVGTTGLSPENLNEVRGLCEKHNTACLVAPNFAIGAVLMMQFAKAAAKLMPACEIIEMHHDQKLDAPSGTALKTAEMVAAARSDPALDKTQKITLEGARGGSLEGIRIHSVRLPGFVASQEVIFGGQGQTLTIRHDTIDRTSFMPGVILAIRSIGATSGLTYGLENLMDL